MDVETLLVETLRSEPEAALPGTDLLTAEWCLRWARDPREAGYYAVECRSRITGTSAELEQLEVGLAGLVARHPGVNIRTGLDWVD